jgi:hypothetical protein
MHLSTWLGFGLIGYVQITLYTYIHTYHLRFIPEGAAEASQTLLRDAHVLPKLLSYEEHGRRDRWQDHRH